MPARIHPFPLVRRLGLVRRQAVRFAALPHRGAEKNLFRQLQIQRDALLRKGVDGSEVEAQVQALEGAIRAEVWRMTFSGGGAA